MFSSCEQTDAVVDVMFELSKETGVDHVRNLMLLLLILSLLMLPVLLST